MRRRCGEAAYNDPMIQLENVHKEYGARVLFAEVTWTILAGQKIGLVGDNGTGKSTLLRILAGLDAPSGGGRIARSGWRVGYLQQETGGPDEREALLEYTAAGRGDLAGAARRLDDLARHIERGSGDAEALAGELAEAHEEYHAAGGWAREANARAILRGLGFAERDFARPLGVFSGGWRARAGLARLLMSAPDLLLLDEPTNHLDLESAEWLESFLNGYQGAVVIVSHDRYFLNRMCREIAELEHGALTLYPYPYGRFLDEKERRIEALADAAARQQREIARQTRFIERFRAKNTKATLVQSRVKALEKVEIIQTHRQTASIGFSFQCAGRGAKEMIQLRGVTQRYGERAVFEKLDYTLWRGDRVALIGPNGAGKSTLLKLLGGQLAPGAGEARTGEGVIVRSFAQRQVDVLDPAKTVYEETVADLAPAQSPRARDILGSFLFTGDDVDKKIASLSGGEKSRVALAKMALAPSHVLLLDEPTNHLDLKSRMALERALAAFEGALVVVSHDRAFMDAMANKVVKVERGRLIEYPGNWSDYERSRLAQSLERERSAHKEAAREPGARKEARREAAQKRQELSRATGPLKRKLEELEEAIAALENEIMSLERDLANPATYRDPRRSGEQARALARAKEALTASLAQWESLAAEIERITAGFPE